MRTVYLGHNPGYVSACHEESSLLAVGWHGGIGGNLEKRTADMLTYCENEKIRTLRHFKADDTLVKILSALSPDLIVVGEYHFLLGKSILDLPPYGTINLHGAPLPRYRGAHPINWMIINGETEGAVTCHYMTRDIDAGDIIAQYRFPILDTDTAIDVRPRIDETGRRVLVDILRRFRAESCRLPATPQDPAQSLYTPPRSPADGIIDWNQSPKRIYDFIRAQTRPYPGAFSLLNGKRVSLWAASCPGPCTPCAAAPGVVLAVAQNRLTVAVDGGVVDIIDWELDGPPLTPGCQFDRRDETTLA